MLWLPLGWVDKEHALASTALQIIASHTCWFQASKFTNRVSPNHPHLAQGFFHLFAEASFLAALTCWANLTWLPFLKNCTQITHALHYHTFVTRWRNLDLTPTTHHLECSIPGDWWCFYGDQWSSSLPFLESGPLVLDQWHHLKENHRTKLAWPWTQMPHQIPTQDVRQWPGTSLVSNESIAKIAWVDGNSLPHEWFDHPAWNLWVGRNLKSWKDGHQCHFIEWALLPVHTRLWTEGPAFEHLHGHSSGSVLVANAWRFATHHHAKSPFSK